MCTKAINNVDKCSALIVEGGAMRGIFSTGVLDAFIEKNFNPFDICIGVSAGSTNLAAYLAGMYKRNYKVYTDYSLRPEFINWRKFVKGGHLVDLDWLWDITIKEMRLNLDNIAMSKKEFYIGVTDTSTGKAIYLKPEKENLEEMIKASSSIPIFYRKFTQVAGVICTDGGLADPIPVMEAYRRNSTKIMVLRSRPYSYTMKKSSSILLSKLYLRKYPKLIEAIENRDRVYQEAIDFIRKPPKGVEIIEVNPPESFQTGRLTKDINILKQDYELGYKIGLDLVEKW